MPELKYFEALGKHGVTLKKELILSIKKTPEQLAQSSTWLGYSFAKNLAFSEGLVIQFRPSNKWFKQQSADALVLTKHLEIDAEREGKKTKILTFS